MNKLNSANIFNLMLAVLMLVVGILFCCSLAIGIEGLSVIIGLILLLIGVGYIINSMFGTRGVLSGGGITGCMVVSLAIIFMAYKLAGLVFLYIPWLLIVAGVLLILDAFVFKFLKNEEGYTNFVVKLVAGTISLALGLCLRLIDGFMQYASVMLGILLVVYAIFILFKEISKKAAN